MNKEIWCVLFKHKWKPITFALPTDAFELQKFYAEVLCEWQRCERCDLWRTVPKSPPEHPNCRCISIYDVGVEDLSGKVEVTYKKSEEKSMRGRFIRLRNSLVEFRNTVIKCLARDLVWLYKYLRRKK